LTLLCIENAYQIRISKINAKSGERIALNEGFDSPKVAEKKDKTLWYKISSCLRNPDTIFNTST
jgi:hypothetical protein